MLIRTHLAITLFFALLFIPFVVHPTIFLVVALIATYIPDVDSRFSKTGRKFYLKPIQWFVGHRGLIHSFTFLILITLGFTLFFPLIALPFFLGYCCHLMADSFTVRGIRPFYPWMLSCSGRIKTAGLSETNVLVFFMVGNFFLIVSRFF